MANGWGGARPNSGPKKRPNPWNLTAGERVDLLAYCKSIGYDPVTAMADMAVDPNVPERIQLVCHKEVARYIHPTLGRVNVEHSGKIEGDLGSKDLEELRRMADEYRGAPQSR